MMQVKVVTPTGEFYVGEVEVLTGQLDRMISELVLVSKRTDLTEVARQTIKHHAEDLILAGQAALKYLAGQKVTMGQFAEDFTLEGKKAALASVNPQ